MTQDYIHQIVEDLHTLVDSKFSSVKKFSEASGIDRFNLSRVFNHHQELSVGLYLRMCEACGVLRPESNMQSAKDSQVTLLDYLRISHENVVGSMLKIVLNPTGD